VNRNDNRLAAFLRDAFYFPPIKMDVRPRKSHYVGAPHASPPEEKEYEQIRPCRLFQFVELTCRERLSAALGIVARAAFHPNGVLPDDFILDANGENAVQDGLLLLTWIFVGSGAA